MTDILLATFNSEKFLSEQIDSILNQDFSDFRLIIRDGGSSDSTRNISARYAAQDPRITILPSEGRSSALQNFTALLDASESEFIMFADHDDVWMPDKISRTMKKYKEVSEGCPPGTPILIFTDTCVVDGQMNKVAESSFKFQNLDPGRTDLRYLLLQNVPSGNTMLFNKELREIAKPISPESVMHDHWVALCAAAFGKMSCLNEATLYYRQHGENVYGAANFSFSYFFSRFSRGRGRILERFYSNVTQGRAFLERFGNRLSEQDREMLEAFASLPEAGFFAKRRILWKYRIFKYGFLRNLGMFLVL